jgi:PAS domain S-box-containing protein
MSDSRITHRRRPRKPRVQAIIRREARLRMLAEHSRDVFFSLRFPEGRYEYISPSITALCGFAPQEFYDDPLTILRCVPPDWRDTVRTWLEEISGGTVAEEYEFPVIGPEGQQRWVRQRQVYCPAPDGTGWLLQGVATDITPLREAQQTQRQSEESLRQLIELWPDQVVLTVNLDAGRHEYVSPSMEQVMGYAPQEFYDDPGLGMRVVAPQWREQAWGWIADFMRGKPQAFYEFELVHKNGEHRWIHQVGVLRPREPGQDRVVQFSFRDITESRRAAKALQESEARYRELAESWTEQVLMRVNLQTGRHEYVSPGVVRIFGYTPEQFYAGERNVIEAVVPEWRPKVAQWLDENRKGILRNEYEYEVMDAWGDRRWVLMRSAIIRDARGEPAVLQAVLFDNTERRRLEDALRESNHRYTLLSDNVVDVIWAMDPELRWTYLSPSAEPLSGTPLEVLLRQPFHETFSQESVDRAGEVLKAWAEVLPGSPQDSPASLLMELIYADGSLVPLEVLARPLRDAAGSITGYCGTARNISARRRMERVEASLSRLARVLLECEDLAQTQVLAAACAEEITGARQVLAAHRDQDTGRYLGPNGQPLPACEAGESLTIPVRHAGEELGRITALGLAADSIPEAPQLLERVAAIFALAVARIRAEEALRKSERMSRKLLESMHEGVWAVDRDQNTIFVNEHLAGMLGYSVAELIGMTPRDVLDDPQRLVALERMHERRLGLSGSADYELTRKDGARLPVHVSASPILDASGCYEGLVCTALNLTERKHMEEELRRNQARFEALYELSRLTSATEAQMAAFTLREAERLTGSSGGALFFVAPGGEELVPLAWRGGPDKTKPSPLATTGDSPWAVVHATRLPLLLNDLSLLRAKLPAGHMAVERFLGVPALDGERPAAILGLTGKTKPYTPDDSLQVSLLMDGMWRIVRSRRDEERIRASLREKEALLREVHHRVKNNLQVVSSLLDMAGRRLSEPQTRRSLEEVRAKVLAMSLVHAQLHGENAGAGRGIDLERYVRALFRQLREIYSGDMDLSVSVALDGLVLGLDQATPLGLALNEILANVFKHGRRQGQQGKVDIRARRDADGRVRLEVRDDGPGLPASLEPELTPSLGMKLMFGLVRHQLHGELTLKNGAEGVLVSILFHPHIAS